MQPITRTLRSGSLAAAATLSLLVVTAPAAMAGGDDAEIEDIVYECTSIDVTSSKAISNVVLEFADGDTQRFEGLPESRTGTFAGTGENSGEVITTAWIKSGNNKSEEGPGYGEEFEFDTSTCEGEDEGEGDTPGSEGNTDTGDDSDDSDTGNTDTGNSGDSDNGDSDTGGDSDIGGDTDTGGDSDSDTGDEGDDSPSDDGDAGDTTDVDTGDAQVESIQEVADETDAADDTDGADEEDADNAPSEDVAVLGETEEREVNAAADTDVRAADTLPNTGAGALPTLIAALATLGLGTGLVRRGRND